jgi:hypothetical protein
MDVFGTNFGTTLCGLTPADAQLILQQPGAGAAVERVHRPFEDFHRIAAACFRNDLRRSLSMTPPWIHRPMRHRVVSKSTLQLEF